MVVGPEKTGVCTHRAASRRRRRHGESARPSSRASPAASRGRRRAVSWSTSTLAIDPDQASTSAAACSARIATRTAASPAGSSWSRSTACRRCRARRRASCTSPRARAPSAARAASSSTRSRSTTSPSTPDRRQRELRELRRRAPRSCPSSRLAEALPGPPRQRRRGPDGRARPLRLESTPEPRLRTAAADPGPARTAAQPRAESAGKAPGQGDRRPSGLHPRRVPEPAGRTLATGSQGDRRPSGLHDPSSSDAVRSGTQGDHARPKCSRHPALVQA